MKQQYVTNSDGECGRYVPAPAAVMPLPATALHCDVTYLELGDGRIELRDSSGNGLGLFSSRSVADRTVAFLNR